jgi:copper chaperone CopZ
MKNQIMFIFAFIASFISFTTTAQTADSLVTTTIKVVNLHCNNDMPTIKKQLQNQEGVDEISFTEINGDKSVFTISYHTSAITQSQIEKVIESTPGCDDPYSRPYKVKKQANRKKKNQ